MAAEKGEKAIVQQILEVDDLRKSGDLVKLKDALIELKETLEAQMTNLPRASSERKSQMEKLGDQIKEINQELIELREKLPLRSRSSATAPLPEKMESSSTKTNEAQSIPTLPVSKWKKFAEEFKGSVKDAAGRAGYQASKAFKKSGKTEFFTFDDSDKRAEEIMREWEEEKEPEKTPAKSRNSPGEKASDSASKPPTPRSR